MAARLALHRNGLRLARRMATAAHSHAAVVRPIGGYQA
jgi:hypothetical protein